MINGISKITLYVNNQEQAKAFWTKKAGFTVRLERQMGPDMKWIEVGPQGGGTVFVLYDRNMMTTQNPEVNVGHPSVILSTDQIEAAREELFQKGVSVGEIMRLPYGSMFQFEDMDGNQFLVRENVDEYTDIWEEQVF